MIRAGYEARTSRRTHWQFLAVHPTARLTFSNERSSFMSGRLRRSISTFMRSSDGGHSGVRSRAERRQCARLRDRVPITSSKRRSASCWVTYRRLLVDPPAGSLRTVRGKRHSGRCRTASWPLGAWAPGSVRLAAAGVRERGQRHVVVGPIVAAGGLSTSVASIGALATGTGNRVWRSRYSSPCLPACVQSNSGTCKSGSRYRTGGHRHGRQE
jgi:hypothetical protein